MLQGLLNGFVSGLAIGTMALAFAVVFMSTRVFYIALGGIYALTPYIVWEASRQGLPLYLGTSAAILAAIVLSTACEKFNHKPLEQRGASVTAHLVSSLGIYILLVQVTAIIWGNEPKILRTGLDPLVYLGGFVLSYSQLLTTGVALALLGSFYVWLVFSRMGLQFRAAAENADELALRGYNLDRVRLIAFLIAGVLAGSISLTRATDFGFNPHGGLEIFFLAVVATVIGGRQSFVGPVVAGVGLGLVRVGVVWILSARWQEAVTFILLAVFLLFRPRGLFGREERLEAEA